MRILLLLNVPGTLQLVTIFHFLFFSENGLEFFFDVKTSLNVSDVSFFPSQRSHTYDLYASAVDKEDVLFVDLESGKYYRALQIFGVIAIVV
jgi:hypothetical protein